MIIIRFFFLYYLYVFFTVIFFLRNYGFSFGKKNINTLTFNKILFERYFIRPIDSWRVYDRYVYLVSGVHNSNFIIPYTRSCSIHIYLWTKGYVLTVFFSRLKPSTFSFGKNGNWWAMIHNLTSQREHSLARVYTSVNIQPNHFFFFL